MKIMPNSVNLPEISGHFYIKYLGKTGVFFLQKVENVFILSLKQKHGIKVKIFIFETCIFVICIINTKLSQLNTSLHIQFHQKSFAEGYRNLDMMPS